MTFLSDRVPLNGGVAYARGFHRSANPYHAGRALPQALAWDAAWTFARALPVITSGPRRP